MDDEIVKEQPAMFRTTPSPSPSSDDTVTKSIVPSSNANLLSQDSAHARRHRKLLDQLIALGIQKLINVPKIAVVGSQSAGKSSILEAISGVTFPRAAGTCTRCPSELRLFCSTSQDWECTVTLRFDRDKNGKQQTTKTISFGGPIYDPYKVQFRLRQAQRAILNPSQDAQSFLRQEDASDDITQQNKQDEANELQFSENVICINVQGKGLRDLSVVDLPGIIANVAKGENDENIGLIKELVKTVIKEDNCVILCCISMNVDYQTQPSVRLARSADPTGKRTLGVLTKPDLVEKGTFHLWTPIIEGHQHELFHGYYLVKNLSPEYLGKKSWQEARQDEKDFFKGKEWVSMKSNASSRMGADNLAFKLAALLEQIIKAKMPIIVKRIKLKHDKVKQELESLPELVPQTNAHLQSLIRTFDEEFKRKLLDCRDENGLADDLYKISLNFWAKMINHRPRFLPVTSEEYQNLRNSIEPDYKLSGVKKILEMRDHLFKEDEAELTGKTGIQEQYGLIDDDESESGEAIEEEEISETEGSSGKESEDEKQSGDASGGKESSTVYDEADNETLVPLLMDMKRQTTYYKFSSAKISKLDGEIVLLNLSEISKLISRGTHYVLPNNIPWGIKTELIESCIKSWPAVTLASLTEIVDRILQECTKLIHKHFSQFKVGRLEEIIGQIIHQLIHNEVNKTNALLEDLFKLESQYKTISTHGFIDRLEMLKDAFVEARKGCKTTYEGEVFPALPDNVDEELNVISEILVYWQIAFKRYTDQVRSAFHTILLQPAASKCLDTLYLGLGIYDTDADRKAKRLLQEEDDIVQRRNDLTARLSTLSQSLKVIDAFKSGEL